MPNNKKKMPKDGYQTVTTLAKRGVSQTQIAKALGMAFKTWKNIRESDPKAKQAMEAGLQIEFDSLIGKAHEMAMDGDRTMLCFLLNNRHMKRMQALDDIGQEGRDNNIRISVVLPKALTPDHYSQIQQGVTIDHES